MSVKNTNKIVKESKHRLLHNLLNMVHRMNHHDIDNAQYWLLIFQIWLIGWTITHTMHSIDYWSSKHGVQNEPWHRQYTALITDNVPCDSKEREERNRVQREQQRAIAWKDYDEVGSCTSDASIFFTSC